MIWLQLFLLLMKERTAKMWEFLVFQHKRNWKFLEDYLFTHLSYNSSRWRCEKCLEGTSGHKKCFVRFWGYKKTKKKKNKGIGLLVNLIWCTTLKCLCLIFLLLNFGEICLQSSLLVKLFSGNLKTTIGTCMAKCVNIVTILEACTVYN